MQEFETVSIVVFEIRPRKYFEHLLQKRPAATTIYLMVHRNKHQGRL
jgi:hypothetical protein